MLNDRDDYVTTFMNDALQTTLRLFDTSLPGTLVSFTLTRTGPADCLTVRFLADERPGITFSYEFPIFDADTDPVRGPRLDVSVFLGAIMERTHRWNPETAAPVDGLVHL